MPSKMERDGFKLVQTSKVGPHALLCQYVPRVFKPEHWEGADHPYLRNSPHVRFVKQMLADDGRKLMDSDYANWQRYLYEIGFSSGESAEHVAKRKVDKFSKLVRMIQKNGYDHTKIINLLDRPMMETRYGETVAAKGFEIYNGHHRAAYAYATGINKLKCNIHRDTKPGSKESRLDFRLT